MTELVRLRIYIYSTPSRRRASPISAQSPEHCTMVVAVDQVVTIVRNHAL